MDVGLYSWARILLPVVSREPHFNLSYVDLALQLVERFVIFKYLIWRCLFDHWNFIFYMKYDALLLTGFCLKKMVLHWFYPPFWRGSAWCLLFHLYSWCELLILHQNLESRLALLRTHFLLASIWISHKSTSFVHFFVFFCRSRLIRYFKQ